jgi:hypothetical protein
MVDKPTHSSPFLDLEGNILIPPFGLSILAGAQEVSCHRLQYHF